MPSSLLALAPTVVTYVADRARELERPIRVLDVGVGRGKYGLLLREYLGESLDRIDGVEAEGRYLEQAPWLRSIYDTVLVDDVTNFVGPEFDIYDLVLMLDVLEHLERADAIRLLGVIGPPVLISTPVDFFQNPEHVDYPTEEHRSHWTAERLASIRPIDREDVLAREVFAAVFVRLAPLGA